MDIIELHRRVGQHQRSVVASVPPDAWGSQTNCEPWTASQLLRHALNSQLLWVGSATGTERIGVGDVMQPSALEGDPSTVTAEVLDEAESAWSKEGILDAELVTPFGPLTGRQSIAFPTLDTLAHTWDLATSVGIDASIPDEICQAVEAVGAFEIMDQMRQFGLMADAVDVGAGASPTDALMARAGRRAR